MESSIALSECAAFGNSGGQLICDAPANADDIPEGSYQGSCGGCAVAGDELSCSHCTGTDGAHHASSIALSTCSAEGQQVGNSDGQLACEDPQPADDGDAGADGRRLEELEPNAEEGLPSGSYLGSCGGCKLEDEVRAVCTRSCLRLCVLLRRARTWMPTLSAAEMYARHVARCARRERRYHAPSVVLAMDRSSRLQFLLVRGPSHTHPHIHESFVGCG